MAPEAKKKAAEAKSRADEAFKRKDYYMAIDAYTQVKSHNLALNFIMSSLIRSVTPGSFLGIVLQIHL